MIEMADPKILEKLIRIDNRTDSMRHSLDWLVRANEPQLKETLIKAFGRSAVRVQVYLALDGKKNVNDLAKALELVREAVSREIAWLIKKGLITPIDADGRGTIYKRTQLDSIIHLSEELAGLFDLDKHGRPVKKK